MKIHSCSHRLMLISCVATMLFTPFVGRGIAHRQQKPDWPRPHASKIPRTPETLRAVFEASTLVVLVRIDRETPVVTPVAGSLLPSDVVEETYYDAMVLKVFKTGDQRITTGNTIKVRRAGVRRGVPAQDVELNDGFAPFDVGGEYVLLMHNNWGDNNPDRPYTPSFGGAGAYRLIDDRIEKLFDAPIAERQHGRKPAAMFKELEAYAKGSGK